MKRNLAILAAAAILGTAGAGAAHAQAASDAVKRECRSVANNVARMIEDLERRGVKDLERGLTKPSTNWGEQVASYMIQSKSRTSSLSEAELASLGYSYCVERRPRN